MRHVDVLTADDERRAVVVLLALAETEDVDYEVRLSAATSLLTFGYAPSGGMTEDERAADIDGIAARVAELLRAEKASA